MFELMFMGSVGLLFAALVVAGCFLVGLVFSSALASGFHFMWKHFTGSEFTLDPAKPRTRHFFSDYGLAENRVLQRATRPFSVKRPSAKAYRRSLRRAS